MAKAVAAGIGLTVAAGATAVATGNGHMLVAAMQHVPSWTHAHTVLSNLGQRMPWKH